MVKRLNVNISLKSYEMGVALPDDVLKTLSIMNNSMQIWGSTTASTANLLGVTLVSSITKIITDANSMARAFNGVNAEVLSRGNTAHGNGYTVLLIE